MFFFSGFVYQRSQSCVFPWFYQSRKDAKALSFLFYLLFSAENLCPSPDSSGNPFAFSFKKQKIGVHSGK